MMNGNKGCGVAWALVAALVLGHGHTCVAQDVVQPGKQVAQQVAVKIGAGDDAREILLRYWLFVPPGYQDGKAVSLMLFLHGSGERGKDLERVKKWGPPRQVAAGDEFPFLLISPQCESGKRWEAQPLAALVNHVARSYRVDRTKMYCTGLSMGGRGTWDLVAAYPDLFAAAVPICGSGDATKAAKLAQVPFWVFHGDQDETVPLERSATMVDAIQKAGGDVRFTVYEGVGHNSWSRAYANQQVYRWLLTHRRPSSG